MNVLFENRTVKTKQTIYDTFFFLYGKRAIIFWILRLALFLILFVWDVAVQFLNPWRLPIDMIAFAALSILTSTAPLRARAKLYRQLERLPEEEARTTAFTFFEDKLHCLDGKYQDIYEHDYSEFTDMQELSDYFLLSTKTKKYILAKAGFQPGDIDPFRNFISQKIGKPITLDPWEE